MWPEMPFLTRNNYTRELTLPLAAVSGCSHHLVVDVNHRPPDRVAQRAALPVGATCPECSYDLRGSTAERCPECGFRTDPLRRDESQIPWCYRHELGWFKAYWKTVWLVLRQPRRLCQEISRPVDYRHSQSWRWVTTLHACGALLVGCGAYAVADYAYGWHGGELMWWWLGGLQVWGILWLAALPGLASYFFHPSKLPIEHQNRAIALSYYAWAPLALAPLCLLLPYLVILGTWQPFPPIEVWAICTAVEIAGAGVIVGLCETRIVQLQVHALHRRRAAAQLRLAAFNALAIGLGLLLALLPLSAFYLLVIFHSF